MESSPQKTDAGKEELYLYSLRKMAEENVENNRTGLCSAGVCSVGTDRERLPGGRGRYVSPHGKPAGAGLSVSPSYAGGGV